MKWSRPESEKKSAEWGEKGKREMQNANYDALIFPPYSFSHAFYLRYFSFSVTVSRHHVVLVQASSVSVHLSSSFISNLGVVADGGGGRVRMVVVMVGG